MVYRSYRRSRLNPIWVLIGTNVLLFIVTLTAPGIILFGGLMPAAVVARPWTVLTCLFLHGGIGHILGNMITLYFFGRYLRALVGDKRFLIVYFVGGILGSVCYILLAPPLSISIGASGAVFAVGGVLAVMRPKLKVLVFPIPVPMPLWAVVIGGFVIISFFPNVAWQSHLGGLVFGLVMGYFLRRQERFYR
ncbi:MAG: rhomboid family intramembrane serine protease [Chloroflexi bacterium]|nr:rhomboid family intramembrane serine protease [Chloroflexota bacterium]